VDERFTNWLGVNVISVNSVMMIRVLEFVTTCDFVQVT
jgi:hypothetical protein